MKDRTTERLEELGQRATPSPRVDFADDLERDLRASHYFGAGATAPASTTGGGWRRPAIGLAVAAVALAVVGWIGLTNNDTNGQVETATIPGPRETSTSPTTSPLPTTTTDAADPSTTDLASQEAASTTAPAAATSTTVPGGSTTTAGAEPTTSTPADPDPPATTEPTATSEKDRSTTTTPAIVITLTVESRSGSRDRLAWSVEPSSDRIAGFEITWISGDQGGTVAVVRNPATRAITVDRPADGTVGYRVTAVNAEGAALVESDVVRAP